MNQRPIEYGNRARQTRFRVTGPEGELLRHADDVGIPIIVDRLSRLGGTHGARFRRAQLLQEMVRRQRRFLSWEVVAGRARELCAGKRLE